MKTKLVLCLLGGVALLLKAGLGIAGTIYDLKTDFSTTSNPNGVWSYTQGGAPITQTISYMDANQTGNGWGYNSSYEGSVMQWTVANVPWHDRQANDVTIHTLSSAYGGDTIFTGITWTSPGDGQVSLSGKAWDAYFYGRNANWSISVDNVLFASHTGIQGIYRTDTAAQFDANLISGKTLNSINVIAGEKITFLTQTTGGIGYFMGVDMTAEFTPSGTTPEPTTLSLLMLGGLVSFANRRKLDKTARTV